MTKHISRLKIKCVSDVEKRDIKEKKKEKKKKSLRKKKKKNNLKYN
jgi:Na+-transporting methylmalonyl-CoA/oxaloacetate decarboxylase gamma subunit